MAYRDDRVAMMARVDALEMALDDAETRRAEVETERDALAAEAALLRAALVRAVASRGRRAPPPRVHRRRNPMPALVAITALATAGFVLTGLAARTARRAPSAPTAAIATATTPPMVEVVATPVELVPVVAAEAPRLAPTRSAPVLAPAWPLTPTEAEPGATCGVGSWKEPMVAAGDSPPPEAPEVRAAVARVGAQWSLHADLALASRYPGWLELGMSAACLLADGQIVEELTGVLQRDGDSTRTQIEFFAGEALAAPLACIVRGGVRFGRTTLEDREIILANVRVD